MHSENYPSRILAEAVEQFSKLPGIGERSALRMALFLLRQKKERNGSLYLRTIQRMKSNQCQSGLKVSDK